MKKSHSNNMISSNPDKYYDMLQNIKIKVKFCEKEAQHLEMCVKIKKEVNKCVDYMEGAVLCYKNKGIVIE